MDPSTNYEPVFHYQSSEHSQEFEKLASRFEWLQEGQGEHEPVHLLEVCDSKKGEEAVGKLEEPN